jgi:hypothetical protein
MNKMLVILGVALFIFGTSTFAFAGGLDILDRGNLLGLSLLGGLDADDLFDEEDIFEDDFDFDLGDLFDGEFEDRFDRDRDDDREKDRD